MASSSLSTDKRWTGAHRKSSMTVLGRIPKPLNLPSQRLENMGLDPNVEIVPKNTFTWGSKSAAPSTNAWASSAAISANSDGGTGSPRHIVARPSSGGGDTRPSTAGSDKSLESTSPWGPASRPSSASGILASNNLLAANRPRSAETRPGSSQLSRFAESAADHLKDAAKTPEKMGLHSTEVPFSSGDFPSLGTEKTSDPYSQRGHSSHGRPTSSSGIEAKSLGMAKNSSSGVGEVIANSQNQKLELGKLEHQYNGSGKVSPKNLQREIMQPQAYPNINMAPQQFDAWRPPSHPPEGPWQRAPHYAPYRPGAPMNSFPVDHFPYYGPYPLNPEAIPPKGGGQPVFHSPNVEPYRPNLPPNSYMMGPNAMPVRPVYQGSVLYDGYFGPHRPTFNSAGERDSSSIMGAPVHLGVVKQYPYQNDNPILSQTHVRASNGDAEMPRERFEHDHVQLARREEHLVLPEQHNREADSSGRVIQANQLHPDGNRHAAGSSYHGPVRLPASDQRPHGPAFDNRPIDSERLHMLSRGTGDGILQVPKGELVAGVDRQPVIKKNAALLGKIEDLNMKSRSIEFRSAVVPPSSQEPRSGQLNASSNMGDHTMMTLSSAAHSSAAQIAESHVIEDAIHSHGHKRASRSRRDGPAKEKLNELKEQNSSDSAAIASVPMVENDQSHDNALINDGSTITSDFVDFDAQRAKMKEIAAQRAKQLQLEEEERTRQQKAKALAKLEELNRRAAAAQTQNIVSNTPPSMDEALKNQETRASLFESSGHSSAELPVASFGKLPTSLKNPNEQTVDDNSKATDDQCSFSGEAVVMGIEADKKINAQVSDGNTEKQKQMVYAVKHSSSHEKNPSDKSTPAASTMNTKIVAMANVDPSNQDASSHGDLPAHNKRANRQVRNKRKVDAVAPGSAPVQHVEPIVEKTDSSVQPNAPLTAQVASSIYVPAQTPLVTFGSLTIGDILGSSDQVVSNGMGMVENQLSNCGLSSQPESKEDANTVKTRIKPQHQKRALKHQHRPAEKLHAGEAVVWAPVNKQVNKGDDTEEKQASENVNVEIKQPERSDGADLNNGSAVTSQVSGRKKNVLEGAVATRTKRAELERYVPKPLSKELQQNALQTLPSKNQESSVENSEKESVDASSANTTVDPRKADDKRSRHGKTHAWRRRHADEPRSAAEHLDESHDMSHDAGSFNQISDQQPLEETDAPASKNDAERKLKSDVSNAALRNSDPPSVKDQGTATRTRRPHGRAPREAGVTYLPSDTKESAADGGHAVHSMNVPEHRSASEARNSAAVVQPRAHWKPKSENAPQNKQQGSSGEEPRGRDSHGMHNSPRYAENQAGEDPLGSWNEDGGGRANTVQRHHGQQSGGRYSRGRGEMGYRGRGGHDAGKQSHGRGGEKRRGSYAYQPVGPYSRASDFEVSEESRPPYNRGGGQFVRRPARSS